MFICYSLGETLVFTMIYGNWTAYCLLTTSCTNTIYIHNLAAYRRPGSQHYVTTVLNKKVNTYHNVDSFPRVEVYLPTSLSGPVVQVDVTWKQTSIVLKSMVTCLSLCSTKHLRSRHSPPGPAWYLVFHHYFFT